MKYTMLVNGDSVSVTLSVMKYTMLVTLFQLLSL